MARATMEDIITRVRGMIGDPAVAESDEPASHFTDDEIQQVLDRRSRLVSELPLDPFVTRDSSGDQQMIRWIADRAPWESDVTLMDAGKVPYAEASIDVADPMNGEWEFTSTQSEVFATGRTFDLYGAAADLLETWAGALGESGGIDFTTDGQSVSRSQKGEQFKSRAAQYRMQSLPVTATFDRDDLAVYPTWH